MINADQLRTLRLDRGLSQRKLAASAGVDALTIKRLEAGTDPGDLTLRILGRIAAALGVHPSAVLEAVSEPDWDANCDVRSIGSALASGERSTRTGLARTAALTPSEVDDAIEHLADGLALLGIAVARHDEEVWLAPLTSAGATGERHRPLDVNQARLLRRIHRGEDVRRALSRVERTMILPSLLRRGLVEYTTTGLHPTGDTEASLRMGVHVRAAAPNISAATSVFAGPSPQRLNAESATAATAAAASC